jgi:uncharacterized protein (AIM24 family)
MTSTSTPPDAFTCPYCRMTYQGTTLTCPSCGASLDVRLQTTSGGWTDLPAMADMTRIQAGQSHVQIEGDVTAVADWRLAENDALFFPHHVLLWQEPSVRLEAMPLAKAWTRHRAGLPIVMFQATGPGQIAFSHDAPGEIVALPLRPGAAIDVCEHRMLVANRSVGYDWFESGLYYSTSGRDAADQGAGAGLLKMGLELAGQQREQKAEETTWHYPMGRYLDRFTAGEQPGLVLISAAGKAYLKDLAEGEAILVKPPALLFKDPSVHAQLHVEYPAAGMKFWRTWGNRYLWLRLTGPGRIGIESAYVAADDPGTEFSSMSQATRQVW